MYSDTVKAVDLEAKAAPAAVAKRAAPRRFFVVGPAGAGKSEFARLLAAELTAAGRGPVVLGECGEVLIGMLARQLMAGPVKLANGHNSLADWIDHIRMWKHKYRGQLRELGSLIVGIQPGALIQRALYGDAESGKAPLTRICVGARRADEYLALCKPDYTSEDPWIYVDRKGAGASDDSFDAEFFLDACQMRVQNDGDVEALRAKAKALAGTL